MKKKLNGVQVKRKVKFFQKKKKRTFCFLIPSRCCEVSIVVSGVLRSSIVWYKQKQSHQVAVAAAPHACHACDETKGPFFVTISLSAVMSSFL